MPSPEALLELYDASGAARWGVSMNAFAEAIAASIARRFPAGGQTLAEERVFAETLYLEDLALACGCRAGNERAWEYFLREVRPQLYNLARSIVRGDGAKDLVDSLIADLYGLADSAKDRRSLLAYYHGRARLITWLRTVVAQRHIDSLRELERNVPFNDDISASRASGGPIPSDPRRRTYITLAQEALDSAVSSLDARDRLRLQLYYGQDLTLSRIGKLLKEHESTTLRKLDKARRRIHERVRASLFEKGLSKGAVEECLEIAANSLELDALRAL